MRSLLLLIGFAIALPSSFLIYTYLTWPNVDDLNKCIVTSMFQVKLCPGGPNYVPLSRISKYVRMAIISSEDAKFYHHSGFDFEALQKVVQENIEKGAYHKGGSTITQQLAKNVFLSQEKSLVRKAKEAIITYEIEKKFSKNLIFEKYLNVVEFGKNIYGIKQASKHYFEKSPSDLSILESCFLAFLLPNPDMYSISFRKRKLTQFAKTRMKQILQTIWKQNKISEEQYISSLVELDQFLILPSDPAVPLDMAQPMDSDSSITSSPSEDEAFEPEEVTPSQEEEPADSSSTDQ